MTYQQVSVLGYGIEGSDTDDKKLSRCGKLYKGQQRTRRLSISAEMWSGREQDHFVKTWPIYRGGSGSYDAQTLSTTQDDINSGRAQELSEVKGTAAPRKR